MLCKNFQICFIIDWRIWEKWGKVKTHMENVSVAFASTVYEVVWSSENGKDRQVKILAGYIVVLFFTFPVVSVCTKMTLNEDMDLGYRYGLRVLHRGRAKQLVGRLSAAKARNKLRKPCALSPNTEEETSPRKSTSLLRDLDTVSLQLGMK